MVLVPAVWSVRKFLRIACTLLSVDVCTPSPQVKAALDALPQRTPADTEWEFHQKFIAGIQEVLRKYPGDFFVLRQYVNAMNGRTERTKVIEEYKEKHESNPGDPSVAYLYGMALLGRQSAEAIKLFTAALTKDPKFPWPHLPLAWIYGSPVFQDKAKQKAHVIAFLDACSTIADGYGTLSEVADKPLIRERAGWLRQQLARRSDPDAMFAYTKLWALEFKANPPSEYERLRKQAAADVQRIRALDSKSTMWYYALVEGYKVADDQKSSDQVQDEWERAFPNPELPSSASFGSWYKEHPFPANEADARAKHSYYEAELEQSKKWTEERPNTTFLWNRRLWSLVELDSSSAEIQAIAEKELEVAKKNAGPEGPQSSEWLSVAEVLSKRHLDPMLLLECAEKGLEQLAKEKERPDWDLYLTKDRIAENNVNLAHREGQAVGYLVDAQIQVEHGEQAQVELVRLDERLQKFKALVGDKQDKRKDYLSFLSAYWGRMARLAELQNRKLDAMSFYENALLARLDAEQKPEAGRPDELADDAKKLWRSLGGTEAGWTMWYGRRAEELARANTLRWEEANEALPSFELVDLSRKTWNVEALKGKVTFLNFWASW